MKLSRTQALALCTQFYLPLTPIGHPDRPDYYALPANTVARLNECADCVSFEKPANANAPRDVYFYGKLGRALAKAE